MYKRFVLLGGDNSGYEMNATKRVLFPFNCKNRLISFLRNPILNLVRLFNNIKPTFTKRYLGPRRRRFEPEWISRLFIHKAIDVFIKKYKRLVLIKLGVQYWCYKRLKRITRQIVAFVCLWLVWFGTLLSQK